MTATEHTSLFNVRIIGRSRTRNMNLVATSEDHARRRAERIGHALGGGTRDISCRVKVVALEGPVPEPVNL